MGRICGWKWVLACLIVWPLGCSQTSRSTSGSENIPIVRVRLLANQDQVLVAARQAPVVRTGSDPQGRRLNFPGGTAVPVALSPGGWRVGTLTLGTGELILQATVEGSLTVNGQAHRGQYRFVPVSAGKFDVINDLDIESYLKGVLPGELPRLWNEETYKAQAIVARTYALYELKTAGRARHWDLYPDERSQMYGGLGVETAKSRQAVDATSGVVVAYGPKRSERIFKTYFSACCGGISQSATDAFGDSYIEPLSDQNNQAICNAAPRFNWGPVIVGKDELTRRFRAWGAKKGRPEKDMALVSTVAIQAANRWGRPTRFVVTDVRGARYSWTGEEVRWAVNTEAPEGSRLFSSFFKVINSPDAVHFVEGHGHGHGVGMCQWCAQRRAEEGMRHEDIVLAAFQRARLVRAY